MEVFLSWSDVRSRQIAEILRSWLPKVIQPLRPWMSEVDISAGAQWLTEVSTSLDNCSIGIVCVTPENQHNPWLQFEAGALSKTLDKTCVCPLVFDMKLGQLSGPLTQFQAIELTKPGIQKVLTMLNSKLPPSSQVDELEEILDVWWTKLEERLLAIPSIGAKPLERSTSEQLNELLEISREQLRRENLRIEYQSVSERRLERMIKVMEDAGIGLKETRKSISSMPDLFKTMPEMLNSMLGDTELTSKDKVVEIDKFMNMLRSGTIEFPDIKHFDVVIDEAKALNEESKIAAQNLLNKDTD